VSAVYVDASALGRVLLGEPAKPAIERELAAFDGRVSSRLLRIELRRLALRAGLADTGDTMDGVAFVPLDEATLEVAETIEPARVATLDAIHLATAVRLAAAGSLAAVLTYDRRLAEGARHHGIPVLSPA